MRIVVTIFSVFLVLFLVACGGSSTATQAPPTPPAPSLSGTFTQSTPTGTYSGLTAGGVDTMVQLADGSVLTMGGVFAPFNSANNSAGVFSVDKSGTLTITQVGNMVGGLNAPLAALMPDGRVLIAGGVPGPGVVNRVLQIYDPKTRTFSSPAPKTASQPLAVFPQKNGTVLILEEDGTAEFYDPLSATLGNAFSAVVPGLAAIAPLKDGRILFAGGAIFGISVPTYLATAQILDPQDHTLTPTGNLSAPRENGSAITLPDGRVLILGGDQGDFSNPLSAAELYDPATGTFSLTGNAAEPLKSPSAIQLPTGKVLVVATNTITAELYDPSTGKFSAAARLAPTSGFAVPYRMFNMPNGSVMVNGGLSQPFNFYHP